MIKCILQRIKDIFKKLKSKLTIQSGWVILFISVYFASVINLSFWRFVITRIDINSFPILVFTFSLILFTIFPLYLLFNLITVPYLGKVLIVLLLIISSSTNYFMFAYGVYIDSDMIRNAFETNQREAFDLITIKGILYVFFTGIIPSILICLTRIKYFPLWKEIKWRAIFILLGFVTLLIFMGVSFKEYASFGRNNREARKLINTLNYNYATIRYIQKQSLKHRKFVKLDPNAKMNSYGDPHKTILVLVIGETARAENFSLNGYGRQTNPLLEKEDIINFHKVKACGTSTAISVPCIFSGDDKDGFNVINAQYTENLLEVLQRSGYDILWLENDDGCKGVCKNIPTEDMVKTKNSNYCDSKFCIDEVLTYNLEERIKNITKDSVIVLHTMGSHGPTYYKRYPDEFRKFTPTCDTAEIQNCDKKEIANTYDNTILYTDYILSSIVNTLKKFPGFEAGMIYISDHGESLGENNIYLHGLPYKIAPSGQTDVPMIIWMSETMKKYDFIDYDCLKQKAKDTPCSHDNLFHSVLGLLEVEAAEYKNSHDIFFKCRTKVLPYQK